MNDKRANGTPEDQPEPEEKPPPAHIVNYIEACRKFHGISMRKLAREGEVDGAELKIEHDCLMIMMDTLVNVLCRHHGVDHPGLYNLFAYQIDKKADEINAPAILLADPPRPRRT